MITTATTAFLVSVIVGLSLFTLIRKERHHGRRFFARTLRVFLDRKVEQSGRWIINSWEHFSKYVVQLNWYYSIHSLLKAILAMIISFYTYFEDMFERNRNKTKQLRAEKRQLSDSHHKQQMTLHREDTTLTENQQRKLKQKELDGKH